MWVCLLFLRFWLKDSSWQKFSFYLFDSVFFSSKFMHFSPNLFPQNHSFLQFLVFLFVIIIFSAFKSIKINLLNHLFLQFWSSILRFLGMPVSPRCRFRLKISTTGDEFLSVSEHVSMLMLAASVTAYQQWERRALPFPQMFHAEGHTWIRAKSEKRDDKTVV